MRKKKLWKQIAVWSLTAAVAFTSVPSSVMAASQAAQVQEAAQEETNSIQIVQKWDFDDAQAGLNGWEVSSDSWAYSGEVSAAYDSETVGSYDYSGYSPGVTTGDIMARILPGGDLRVLGGNSR